MLRTLEDRHLPWGIVTNKIRRFTDPLVRELELDRRAACVVSDLNRPKILRSSASVHFCTCATAGCTAATVRKSAACCGRRQIPRPTWIAATTARTGRKNSGCGRYRPLRIAGANRSKVSATPALKNTTRKETP